MVTMLLKKGASTLLSSTTFLLSSRLNFDADINAVTTSSKQAPIHLATLHKHLSVVQHLLENGAKLLLTDEDVQSKKVGFLVVDVTLW